MKNLTSQVAVLGAARISDKVILGVYAARIQSKEQKICVGLLKEAIQKLSGSTATRAAARTRSSKEERQEVVYLQVDKSAAFIFGAVVTNRQYPERIAYRMLSEFEGLFVNTFARTELLQAKENSKERAFKEKGRVIINKYADLTKIDPTTEVIEKVESVKIVINEQIKKALKNNENIQQLACKTDTLAQTAKQFHKDAAAVERKTNKQKIAVCFTLFLLSTLVIVYAVYSFMDLFVLNK